MQQRALSDPSRARCAPDPGPRATCVVSAAGAASCAVSRSRIWPVCQRVGGGGGGWTRITCGRAGCKEWPVRCDSSRLCPDPTGTLHRPGAVPGPPFRPHPPLAAPLTRCSGPAVGLVSPAGGEGRAGGAGV